MFLLVLYTGMGALVSSFRSFIDILPGSGRVAKIICAAAAKTLSPVTLEVSRLAVQPAYTG